MRTDLAEAIWPGHTKAALANRSWLQAHIERIAVGAILVLFVSIGIGYSLIVPPFETPDEVHHYAFARHLSLGNPLPVQTVERSGPWEHEGTQPPLYYFLLGRIIAGIDQSDFPALNRVNPHANLGNPLYPGNKNKMLYSSRPLPLRSTNLAVHVGRWFSLFLASLSLLLVHATARLAFPRSRLLPLMALLLVAFIPQFNFISASVSNDNMVILVSTATVYWLARLLVRDARQPVLVLEWLVLGVLLGLAGLSKLQGLGLAPLAGLVILALAWKRRDWRLPLRALAPVGGTALLIAGWWYWRNYSLYGEWLGVNQLLSINGLRYGSQTWEQLWGELRGVRYSFWGLFGWFSILLPEFTYRFFDLLALLAVGGFIATGVAAWKEHGRGMLRWPSVQVHGLLSLWLAMLIGLLIYWLTFATSGQGRLLFPGLSAVGVIFATGLGFWLRLLPRSWRLPAFAVVPASLLACSVYALTVLLPGFYAAPSPVAQAPAEAIPVNLLYDGKIELVAVEVPDGRYRPGEQVPVTLYLRARKKLSKDYPLFVQLLDPDNREIGNVTTHPGWGRNPTSLWEPGAIYADRYEVTVWGNISNRSPLLARLYVGFIDPETHTRLRTPADVDPGLPGFLIDSVEIEPAQPLDPNALYLQPVDIPFVDQIRLIGYGSPGVVWLSDRTRMQVTLLWEATGQPSQDYTAFIHLVDGEGRQVAGFDQPPAEGRFPTSRWRFGDLILSRFPLDLPPDLAPGVYEIWIGLYSDPEGVDRLPVGASELPVQDHRVLLTQVEIR